MKFLLTLSILTLALGLPMLALSEELSAPMQAVVDHLVAAPADTVVAPATVEAVLNVVDPAK